MNNYFPYDEKEWEKITEDAFAPDAPEPQFSEAYQKRKQKMLSSVTERRFHMKRATTITIAAALAVAVLTPSVAVAANYAYQAWQTKTNLYQNTVQIEAGTETSDQIMALSYGWLPEGMSCVDGWKYSDGDERYMTPFFWRLPEDTASLSAVVDYVIDQETYTTESGNTVLYTKRDVGFNQMWVAFTGTVYAAQLYVNGMSEEETRKIAENLTLVPSETETASVWTPETPESGEYVYEDLDTTIDPTQLNLCHVGDTVSLIDDATGKELPLEMTIHDAVLQDDFTGIHTNSCGMEQDYSCYLDEDGRIRATRTETLLGDGVNTLDEILLEETVEQCVLVLNLTLINQGDTTVEELIWSDAFSLENNSVIRQSDSYETAEGTVVVSYSNGTLMADDSNFSMFTDGEYQKNNITLAPGESVEVQLAFLINRETLGNLYINLDGGAFWPATCIAMGKPILDLCDLT